MLLLKAGIRNQFAQDVVVGKEAAVLLFVCVEGRGWGTRTVMRVVASLSAHLIGTEAAAGPPAAPPSPDAPAAALTPGPRVRLAP